MGTAVNQYVDRAENELRLSIVLRNLSQSGIRVELGALKEDTFYSAAISHAYYAIFYSAKAILLSVYIKTAAPGVHQRTLEQFKKHFVDSGKLDVELLRIYRKMIIRADGLLGLFQLEKAKRGTFTYKAIPQANLEPADESMGNAETFVRSIKLVLEKKERKKRK